MARYCSLLTLKRSLRKNTTSMTAGILTPEFFGTAALANVEIRSLKSLNQSVSSQTSCGRNGTFVFDLIHLYFRNPLNLFLSFVVMGMFSAQRSNEQNHRPF